MNKNRSVNFSNRKGYTTVACGLLLAVASIASAQQSTDLKFRGGIGVIPVTGVAVNGLATLNVVRGINPAGPWRIADLSADVNYEGRINVKGRGLLLAAGNGIGTNAGAKRLRHFILRVCQRGNSSQLKSSGPRCGRGFQNQ